MARSVPALLLSEADDDVVIDATGLPKVATASGVVRSAKSTEPFGIDEVELTSDSVVWKLRPQPMRGAILS